MTYKQIIYLLEQAAEGAKDRDDGLLMYFIEMALHEAKDRQPAVRPQTERHVL